MKIQGGYCTPGSGKSQARHLYGVIVYGVMIGFVITAWRSGAINGSWAAIITALTTPLGAAWVFGKIGRGPDNAAKAKESGAQDETGDAK